MSGRSEDTSVQPHRLIGWILLLCSVPAWGQESLSTVLDRGYVAEWMVCGPFRSDLAEGILSAISRDEVALGQQDYMSPIGGISRTRPVHRLEVRNEFGVGIWRAIRAYDTSLDLAPFFADQTEGVAFAAFYVNAVFSQDVYFDLQSLLGVRVFHNGFPAHELRALPLPSAGVDRFVVSMSRGMNLIVLQIPGVHYAALAKQVGDTPTELCAKLLLKRPLLQGTILVLAMFFVVLNLVVDIVQTMIDPRMIRN